MRWKFGVSGIKIIKHAYIIGIMAQMRDKPNTLNYKYEYTKINYYLYQNNITQKAELT